jgi:hypothetical protein
VPPLIAAPRPCSVLSKAERRRIGTDLHVIGVHATVSSYRVTSAATHALVTVPTSPSLTSLFITSPHVASLVHDHQGLRI